MRQLLIVAVLLSGPALSDPPRVVTDIPPVHALVASVMQGVGSPDLLLPPGSSPHDYALRPSQARTLAEADIVVWIGPALTPWLERAVAMLGRRARLVGLLDAPGTVRLAYVEHGEDDGHRDGHDGEDVGKDGAGGDSHDDGRGHGHDGATDPHAWLDPANAREWLALIAEVLADADPGNADLYRRNARQAVAGLAAAEATVAGLLAPVRAEPFVLYHDAFRYFQAAFSVRPLAVIADGDAVRPGAARLSRVRGLLAGSPGACVFLEPQIPASAVEAVIAGTGARIAVLDPLGAHLTPGPDLYEGMLTAIARAMLDCMAR